MTSPFDAIDPNDPRWWLKAQQQQPVISTVDLNRGIRDAQNTRDELALQDDALGGRRWQIADNNPLSHGARAAEHALAPFTHNQDDPQRIQALETVDRSPTWLGRALGWMIRANPLPLAQDIAAGLLTAGAGATANWGTAVSGKPERLEFGDVLTPQGTGMAAGAATMLGARLRPRLFHDPLLARGSGPAFMSAGPEQAPHLPVRFDRTGQAEMPFLHDASRTQTPFEHSKPDSETGMYSALTRAMETAKINSGNPQQWRNHMQKQGVKSEERHWSGIDDWLGDIETFHGPNYKVSRDDTLGYAKRNEVKPGYQKITDEGQRPASIIESEIDSIRENARERGLDEIKIVKVGDGAYAISRDGELLDGDYNPVKDGAEPETYSGKRSAQEAADSIYEREVEADVERVREDPWAAIRDTDQEIGETTSSYLRGPEYSARRGRSREADVGNDYAEHVLGIPISALERKGSGGHDVSGDIVDDPHPDTKMGPGWRSGTGHHGMGWSLRSNYVDQRTGKPIDWMHEGQSRYGQDVSQHGFRSEDPTALAAAKQAGADAQAAYKAREADYAHMDDGSYRLGITDPSTHPYGWSNSVLRGKLGEARGMATGLQTQIDTARKGIEANRQKLIQLKADELMAAEKGDRTAAGNYVGKQTLARQTIDQLEGRIAKLEPELARAEAWAQDKGFAGYLEKLPLNYDAKISQHRSSMENADERIALMKEQLSRPAAAEMHPSARADYEQRLASWEAERAKDAAEINRLVAERAASGDGWRQPIAEHESWMKAQEELRLRMAEAGNKLKTLEKGLEPAPWVGSTSGFTNPLLKQWLWDAANNDKGFVGFDPKEAPGLWGKHLTDYYERTIPQTLQKLVESHAGKGKAPFVDVYPGGPRGPVKGKVEIGERAWHRPDANGQEPLPFGSAGHDRAPFAIERSEPIAGVNQGLRIGNDIHGAWAHRPIRPELLKTPGAEPVWIMVDKDGTPHPVEGSSTPQTFRSRESAEAAMRDFNRNLLEARRNRVPFDAEAWDGVVGRGIEMTPALADSISSKGFTTFGNRQGPDSAARSAFAHGSREKRHNNHESTTEIYTPLTKPYGHGGHADQPSSFIDPGQPPFEMVPRSDGSGEHVWPHTEAEEALQRQQGARAAPDLWANKGGPDSVARAALSNDTGVPPDVPRGRTFNRADPGEGIAHRHQERIRQWQAAEPDISQAEVARRIGINPTTLASAMSRHGADLGISPFTSAKPPNPGRLALDRIREMFAGGATRDQVRREFDMTPGQMGRFVAEYGDLVGDVLPPPPTGPRGRHFRSSSEETAPVRAAVDADRTLPFEPAATGRKTGNPDRHLTFGDRLGQHVDMKVGMKDADFWIVRRGSADKVGTVTKDYNPEHIGIKVRNHGILSDYLYYALQHAHGQGYYGGRAHGTTNLVNIKKSDVGEMPIQASGYATKGTPFEGGFDRWDGNTLFALIGPRGTRILQALSHIDKNAPGSMEALKRAQAMWREGADPEEVFAAERWLPPEHWGKAADPISEAAPTTPWEMTMKPGPAMPRKPGSATAPFSEAVETNAGLRALYDAYPDLAAMSVHMVHGGPDTTPAGVYNGAASARSPGRPEPGATGTVGARFASPEDGAAILAHEVGGHWAQQATGGAPWERSPTDNGIFGTTAQKMMQDRVRQIEDMAARETDPQRRQHLLEMVTDIRMKILKVSRQAGYLSAPEEIAARVAAGQNAKTIDEMSASMPTRADAYRKDGILQAVMKRLYGIEAPLAVWKPPGLK